MTKSAGEVAKWFSAINDMDGANFSDEVYPGYPGLVIANGEVQAKTWGFPLKQKSRRTGEPIKPRPVNNARSDKLDKYMWRYSFQNRRCLIPLTAWAEAEGAEGSKARTWLSMPDGEVFAAAGIWRHSQEWGECYSMVMTDAAGDARNVHERMPVILRRDDYDVWTCGSPPDAKALCQPWQGSLQIDRTSQPWSARR